MPLVTDLDYGELALNYSDSRLYFKTATNTIQYISGRAVTIAGTAPSSPLPGDMWWDTVSTVLYIYYYNGVTYSWMPALPRYLVESPAGTFTLTGNLVVTGDVTIQGTLYETSDKNLKRDVKTIVNALETLSQLNGVTFKWIKNNKKSMGLIAQEVEQTIPFLIQEDSTGTKSINYTAFIGLLIEAIKELNEKVEKIQPSTTRWSRFKKFIIGK